MSWHFNNKKLRFENAKERWTKKTMLQKETVQPGNVQKITKVDAIG